MKKLLFFIVFVMGSIFSYGQSAEQVDKIKVKEMDWLVKIVTYDNDNLTFNKNQSVKLERILLKKASELAKLRMQENITKSEYVTSYQAVVSKYEPMIVSLLTSNQKIAYTRNHKKPIKLMKD